MKTILLIISTAIVFLITEKSGLEQKSNKKETLNVISTDSIFEPGRVNKLRNKMQ